MNETIRDWLLLLFSSLSRMILVEDRVRVGAIMISNLDPYSGAECDPCASISSRSSQIALIGESQKASMATEVSPVRE